MTPYDPMRDFQTFVRTAATELGDRVYDAASAPGLPDSENPIRPFATYRDVGGPSKQAQIGQESWRIDLMVYHESVTNARAIANKIHAAIATRGAGGGTIQLPSIFGESGPVGLVDEDRRLPFVQRSYIVTFEV